MEKKTNYQFLEILKKSIKNIEVAKQKEKIQFL